MCGVVRQKALPTFYLYICSYSDPERPRAPLEQSLSGHGSVKITPLMTAHLTGLLILSSGSKSASNLCSFFLSSRSKVIGFLFAVTNSREKRPQYPGSLICLSIMCVNTTPSESVHNPRLFFTMQVRFLWIIHYSPFFLDGSFEVIEPIRSETSTYHKYQ